MCLMVDANGNGTGAGTHVSMFVYLMRGEYDDRLVWPFRGTITIELINQINNWEHVKYTLCFHDGAGESADRVISRFRASTGWGTGEFISHAKVQAITAITRYIKDKCMKLKVVNVEVHSE